MLVLEQVVKNVDRRLTREEHLENEVRRAPIDGDEKRCRVRRFDGQLEQIQACVDDVQWGPNKR